MFRSSKKMILIITGLVIVVSVILLALYVVPMFTTSKNDGLTISSQLPRQESAREMTFMGWFFDRFNRNNERPTAPTTPDDGAEPVDPPPPTLLQAGMQRIDISVGGQERYFLVHRPQEADLRPGVVLIMHGGGGTAETFVSGTQSMIDTAEAQGFLAVYPDGNGNWNDGRNTTAGTQDDVAFLRAVVDWLVENANADRTRVFSTGISNGGMMSAKLACDAPDLVSAIAPVAASMSQALFDDCDPAEATPVMMFSGTEDNLNLYNGGAPRFASGSDTIVAHETVAAFWAQVAQCGSARTQVLPDRHDDGTTVSVITYQCPAEQVTLYRIEGGGHTWPGGGQEATGRMAQLVGLTTQEIDATALMTSFFANYGL